MFIIKFHKVPEIFPNRKVGTVHTEQLCPGGMFKIFIVLFVQEKMAVKTHVCVRVIVWRFGESRRPQSGVRPTTIDPPRDRLWWCRCRRRRGRTSAFQPFQWQQCAFIPRTCFQRRRDDVQTATGAGEIRGRCGSAQVRACAATQKVSRSILPNQDSLFIHWRYCCRGC